MENIEIVADKKSIPMTERDYTEQAASTMQSLLEKYKTSMKMYINSYVSQQK